MVAASATRGAGVYQNAANPEGTIHAQMQLGPLPTRRASVKYKLPREVRGVSETGVGHRGMIYSSKSRTHNL